MTRGGDYISATMAFGRVASRLFGAAYTLWMYRRVVFGEVANAAVAGLKDLSAREALVLGLLAVAVLGMGLWPLPFTEVLHTSVNDLVAHVGQSKLPAR